MPLPPFFCQSEAVETVIWLTEVAGKPEHKGRKAKLATAQRYWEHLFAANEASDPDLVRMALKLATGAGKLRSWRCSSHGTRLMLFAIPTRRNSLRDP